MASSKKPNPYLVGKLLLVQHPRQPGPDKRGNHRGAVRNGNAKTYTAGSQQSQVRRIDASRYDDGEAATLTTTQFVERCHRSHTCALLPASQGCMS